MVPLVRMPPGHLPLEVFIPRGRPRTLWRDYISYLAWEHLGDLPGEAGESRWEEGCPGLLPLDPASDQQKMTDGWVSSSRNISF